MSYADDTQILVSAKTAKEVKLRIEKLIEKAQQWYNKNSLLNNATKTEVMTVSKRKVKSHLKSTKLKMTNQKNLNSNHPLKYWVFT